MKGPILVFNARQSAAFSVLLAGIRQAGGQVVIADPIDPPAPRLDLCFEEIEPEDHRRRRLRAARRGGSAVTEPPEDLELALEVEQVQRWPCPCGQEHGLPIPHGHRFCHQCGLPFPEELVIGASKS